MRVYKHVCGWLIDLIDRFHTHSTNSFILRTLKIVARVKFQGNCVANFLYAWFSELTFFSDKLFQLKSHIYTGTYSQVQIEWPCWCRSVGASATCGYFSKTFTSVIYHCDYCFQTQNIIITWKAHLSKFYWIDCWKEIKLEFDSITYQHCSAKMKWTRFSVPF